MTESDKNRTKIGHFVRISCEIRELFYIALFVNFLIFDPNKGKIPLFMFPYLDQPLYQKFFLLMSLIWNSNEERSISVNVLFARSTSDYPKSTPAHCFYSFFNWIQSPLVYYFVYNTNLDDHF